jgi:hypothetical protein
MELDSCAAIVERLQQRGIDHHRNNDIVDEPHMRVSRWPVAADKRTLKRESIVGAFLYPGS